MLNINPQSAIRNPQRVPRRGSILIMVVALLTLIALIGTALIATARTDRYTTRAYVDAATQDATRQQFIDQAVSLVEDALKNDKTPTIDSPRYDTWLADRLPTRLDPASAVSTSNPPVWRHISGWLVTDPNATTVLDPTKSTVVRDFQPPYQISSTAPVSIATEDKTTSYIKILPGLATATTLSSKFFSAEPTSISITYPPTHPVESIRNQTRTYPALKFYNDAKTQVGVATGYLAGDADGDGIADAALVRLSPTPVDGITYYAAVRIIDNNSAVNVNTAWSRDHDFDGTGAQVNPTGFFPSNVGLYELLSQDKLDSTGRVDRDNEIAELNEYRFGYLKDQKATNNWTDSFQDFSTSAPQATVVGLKPVEDPEPDTSPVNFGNNDKPTARTDFTFTTQGEALSLQLGRRIDNPGFNTDPAYTPPVSQYFPSPSAGDPFNFRAYSLTDASTAALAYHFLMANPDAAPSDLELRLRKSIYESAPNYTDYPHGSGKLPGYGFSSDTKVHHWSSFPANEPLLWFQYLDFAPIVSSYTSPVDSTTNTDFTPTRPAGTSGPALTGPQQFRSVRPLLTTYSATSNLLPDAYRWTNSFYAWRHSGVAGDKDILYPGMLPADLSSASVATWGSSGSSSPKMFDLVKDSDTGLTYMRITSAPGDTQPSTDATNQYWDPQPLVTGHAKTNVNLAGFPELWRAYFSLMYNSDTGTAASIDGGTPVDSAYIADYNAITGSSSTSVTMSQAFFPNPSGANLQLYDIYRGMHWLESYSATADPTFYPKPNLAGTQAEQNALRMFRSTIRDPRDPATAEPSPGLHRLTPYQMMALRSAIAAVNTKQLLSPTKATDVVSRTITLYDVDPQTTNGLPDPPAGGTPQDTNPVPQYEVTVYGNAPQPYITEVFATNDNATYTYTDVATSTTYTANNPNGYVAIELYNPYDVDINLSDFTLLSIPRESATYTGTGTDVTAGTTVLMTIPTNSVAPYVVPAHGYCILEATDPASPNSYRPPAAQFVSSGGTPPNIVPCPNLTKVIGAAAATPGELVLLRPRRYQPKFPGNIYDKVPVDQFDFTGFPRVTVGATKMTSWHYARRTDGWYFVYPGRYDARVTAPDPRHQGVHQTSRNGANLTDHTYTPNSTLTAVVIDPWTPDNAAILPQPFQGLVQFGTKAWTPVTDNPDVTLGAPNAKATYSDDTDPELLSIQLANVDMPGRHPAIASGNAFPFGGFARNGDILQVPYIGAYRIRRLQQDISTAGIVDRGKLVDTPQTVLEFNSVTMDAAFAEDTDPLNNTGDLGQENVGRFTPVATSSGTYDWTRNLFTYLTVDGAPLDYLPNTSPYTYPPGVSTVTDQPQPVANGAGGTVATANDVGGSVNEDLIPSQGKININTAPFRVLASLPLVPNGTGGIDVPNTEALADSIIKYRDPATGTGKDFQSIFDLHKVPLFIQGGKAVILNSDPSELAGDYSGAAVNSTGSPDGVRFDFEEQYLMMNRISNLITTHSDTYTVYVLVQGWRDAGTPYPVLDWEKRVAYIMDRSSGTIKKVAVPAD